MGTFCVIGLISNIMMALELRKLTDSTIPSHSGQPQWGIQSIPPVRCTKFLLVTLCFLFCFHFTEISNKIWLLKIYSKFLIFYNHDIKNSNFNGYCLQSLNHLKQTPPWWINHIVPPHLSWYFYQSDIFSFLTPCLRPTPKMNILQSHTHND